ncbi:MAG: CRISPR-associated protein Cmr3 [Ktedonobacteraceae bacterium]|nr:CRISPR-associated protein Cmr3 [Ktedonobacteraceae bacterium]
MTIWLVEPRDPLIVREGRPFGPDAGASATSLSFPFPSTMAGGARSRSAIDENGAFKYERAENMTPEDLQAYQKQLDQLKEIRVRGPLLVQLADDDHDLAPDENAWLVPMPNDAQLFETNAKGKDMALVRRLVPLTLPTRAQTDFEQGKQLLLVGQSHSTATQSRKPLAHKLRYWYWTHFQTWLTHPEQLEQKNDLSLSALGYEELIREYRQHVSMDSDREMGKEGMLFGTSGLEFTHPGAHEQRLHHARRLALAIDVDDHDHGTSPLPGVTGFGGERRIVTWRPSQQTFPACPQEVKDELKRTGSCRLILLTPACFKEGYYPTWVRTDHAQACGVTVTVQAIATRRPQVVSGWDLALSRPKPSRRLAPAGTVLFLSVRGNASELDQWIEQTWMQCISDDVQDRRDGFGLAVLGTWSGQPATMH